MAKPIIDAEMHRYIGEQAIWNFPVRGGDYGKQWVQIIDARRSFGRMDLLVQTNAGSQHWASQLTVELPEDLFKKGASMK